MIRIKSAQVPDFIDVDVRRAFGYAQEALHTTGNEGMIQQLSEAEQELLAANRYITLPELLQLPLGETLQRILGADHWVFNPNAGII